MSENSNSNNKQQALPFAGGSFPKGTRLTGASVSVQMEIPEEVRTKREFAMQTAIAIDCSGSMSLLCGEEDGAKTRFQESVVCARGIASLLDSGKGDWLGLCTFNDRTNEMVPMGPVGDRISKQLDALDKVTPSCGTSLYDTVVRCAESLPDHPDKQQWLFIITDGQDNDSTRFCDDEGASKDNKTPLDGPMLGCRKVHAHLQRLKARLPHLHVSVMAVDIKTTDKAFAYMQMMVGHASANSVGQVYSVKSGSKALVRKCEEVVTSTMRTFTLDRPVSVKAAMTMMLTDGDESTTAKEPPKMLKNGMSTTPCSFFAKGKCRFGDSCTFSHASVAPAPTQGLKTKTVPTAIPKTASKTVSKGGSIYDEIISLAAGASPAASCNCPAWVETGVCVNLGHGLCSMLHDPTVKGLKKNQMKK